MSDAWVRVAILLLRPIELWHERSVRRAYAKGRFRPPEQSTGAVTTRRPA